MAGLFKAPARAGRTFAPMLSALIYTGATYPLREDRVVFLARPERSWGQAYG